MEQAGGARRGAVREVRFVQPAQVMPRWGWGGGGGEIQSDKCTRRARRLLLQQVLETELYALCPKTMPIKPTVTRIRVFYSCTTVSQQQLVFCAVDFFSIFFFSILCVDAWTQRWPLMFCSDICHPATTAVLLQFHDTRPRHVGQLMWVNSCGSTTEAPRWLYEKADNVGCTSSSYHRCGHHDTQLRFERTKGISVMYVRMIISEVSYKS